MPVFSYQAEHRTSGRSMRGQVTADNPREARDQLRRRSLWVRSLAELNLAAAPGTGPSAEEGRDNRPAGPRRVLAAAGAAVYGLASVIGRTRRLEAVAGFIRQLAVLLGAGIPLAEALATLVRQGGGRIEPVLRDLAEQIRGGRPLAESLERHPRWFDELTVGIVRVGETAGELETALSRLADFRQRSLETRGRVKAALAYPAVLTVITAGVVTFLLTAVVPRILAMLESSGRPLPAVTELLLWTSRALTDGGPWIAAGLLALFAGIRLLLARADIRRRWDHARLRIPILGPLALKEALSQWSEVMSTLLAAGVPLDRALDISAGTLPNTAVAAGVRDLSAAVTRGDNLAGTRSAGGLFPPMVVHMLAVGEEGGQLEAMLNRVAESYRREVGLAVQKALAALEPLLIVFMAGLVGFIVFATMLPILEMSQVM